MDLASWKEKAKKLLNGFKGMGAAIPGKIKSVTGRLIGRVPSEKRRGLLFGFGGAVVFLFILGIGVMAFNSRRPERSILPNVSAGTAVPVDDLFMPGEPDFLPEFLLERDPRRFWSLENISPYWKNPAESGKWKDIVRSAVDQLMETVP